MSEINRVPELNGTCVVEVIGDSHRWPCDRIALVPGSHFRNQCRSLRDAIASKLASVLKMQHAVFGLTLLLLTASGSEACHVLQLHTSGLGELSTDYKSKRSKCKI